MTAIAIVALMTLSVIVSAVVFVPQAGSAAPSTNSAAAAPPFRSLRLGQFGLKAATINPNAITLTLEFVVVYNVYSTLVTSDSKYLFTPDLASSWEVAPDNVTWTFHLVRGGYFTDPANPTDRSHPVTADDIVFSYGLVMNNSASILHSYTTEIVSVSKIDTYTVQMVTRQPYAAMYSTLTNVVIFPKYAWENIRNPVTQQPANPIGSGAMYYDPNSVLSTGPIILGRNPNYYGDAAYCRFSRPDEVRIITFSTSGAMVDSLKSGQDGLDGIFAVEASTYLNGLPPSGQGGIMKWAVDSGFVGEIGINLATPALRQQFNQFRTGTNNPLLLNWTIRKAIAMSIDRAAIVKYAYLGLATEGDSLVPAVNPWHYDIPASEEYAFDPAAARSLLNAAGWAYDAAGNPATPTTTPLYKAGGTDPLSFRLYTPDSHAEFAVAVANMTAWLRQAGIQTTDDRGNTVPGYIILPVNQMNSIWKSADFDLWLWDWDFNTLAEPSTEILEVQTTMAIPSDGDTWYSNSTYDALYNQSLVTVNTTARRAIMDEMQRMIYDYAGYIIPYYAAKLYAATNDSTLGYGWENWGDFKTIPGAAPDSDLPNLWFQLYPHDNVPPVISAFPSIDYVSGSPANINVIVSNPDGDPMNFSWDFGDGSALVNTTTNVVPHTYAQAGNYTISVRVKDSEWPACASTTAKITAGGAGNAPPQANLNYQLPAVTGGVGHGWVNESISFSVNVSDPEGDTLNISWTFGDGARASDTATGTQTEKVVTRTHTYSSRGNFTLTVVVTDNKTGAGNHTQLKTAVIPVWPRPVGGGGTVTEANPWINYGLPIAIVAAIALGAVAAILRRRRAAKGEEVKEEPQQPPQPPPP